MGDTSDNVDGEELDAFVDEDEELDGEWSSESVDGDDEYLSQDEYNDDWNGEEEEFNVDDDEFDDVEGINGDGDDYVNEDTTEGETYPIGKEEQDINFDKNALSTNENIPGNTAQGEVNGETNTDEWWDDDEGSMISFPVLFALAIVVGLVFYWKK